MIKLTDTCCFLFRVQQDLKPLPLKKCPRWSTTSSPLNSTRLRFPRVSVSARSTLKCLPVCRSHSNQICLLSESKRSYQMSSFVETKALEHLTKTPVEFVEHPLKHKPHVWSDTPRQTRTSASIIHDQTYDLNNQICQTVVHLTHALFPTL